MSSILDRAAKIATDAIGLKIEDGQIVLSESQIQEAQNLVTRLLDSSSGSGKSISGVMQNWRVVGEPILAKYGIYIGLTFSAIVSVGILIGYNVGKNKRGR
jgi:hypothetical protein